MRRCYTAMCWALMVILTMTANAQKVKVTASFVDGSILVGDLVGKTVGFKALFGDVDIPVRVIREISVSEKSDSILFVNGDKLTGKAQMKDFKIKCIFGNVDLKKKFVSKLEIKGEDNPSDGVRLWADGPRWAVCNLGAEKPEDAGIYLPWRGKYAGESKTDRPQVKFDPVAQQMPGGWRTPEEKDYQMLIDKCHARWESLNGVAGIRFTGKGAYSDKSVFFPAAGERLSGRVEGAGSFGNYWTSEQDKENPSAARYMSVNPRGPGCHYHFNYFACMIRPVKD